MDFVTDVSFEGVCSPDRYRGRFHPAQKKLEISLLTLKWELDFLRNIKEIFNILYRHVEKGKLISHQGRKICSNLISIYVPFYLF